MTAELPPYPNYLPAEQPVRIVQEEFPISIAGPLIRGLFVLNGDRPNAPGEILEYSVQT